MSSLPFTPANNGVSNELKYVRSFGILRRLLALTLPFWRGMTLAALLGALTIASSIGLMTTSAWMISKAALQPSIAELGVAVVAVRFFGIARGVFRYLERLVSHDTTFRLLADLRVRFYRAIEPLDLGDYRSGDLLSRVVDDIESLQNVYLRAIAPPLVALMIAAGITLLLAAFDPLIALVALAFLLAAGTSAPLLAWRSRGGGRARVEARAELNAALIDTVQGMAESLVYRRAADRLAKLDALNRRLSDAETSLTRIDGIQSALALLLANGAALAVLALAIPRVEPIYLATLALGTLAAFEAINPLAQAAAHFGANLTAARRLFGLIDAPPAVIDPPEPASVEGCDLRLADVTFHYTPDASPALSDLSLTIPAGARVAVVGASGSGKSTLVSLLARLRDPSDGTIQLGGRDLREYAAADVRERVGVLEQRTHLFNTTIRENIWIGRREASEDEVVEAARRAQIHDFIASLPDGYGTLVGENGVRLSAGERQRVALARVLLKDAPILVLDEPTANLDTLNERAILDTIFAESAGRTLILLTHRLVMLDQVDVIVVMRDGRIVEQGAEADLLARGGYYARMVRAQK
jgi:ATP-binding cassette subfamily C protein CydC